MDFITMWIKGKVFGKLLDLLGVLEEGYSLNLNIIWSDGYFNFGRLFNRNRSVFQLGWKENFKNICIL